MEKTIIKTAEKFQQLARQAKQLDAQMGPLKNALIQYASTHRHELDQSFQLKFPNGTFVQFRVKDVIEATDDALNALINELDEQFIIRKIDERKLIDAAKTNRLIHKQLTTHGARISQKETFAVYAG
jgi:hypothetical protein